MMTGKGKGRTTDREQRLAEALRENLRRRKTQARDAASQAKNEPIQPARE
jgi:hypothetical protein